MADPVTEITAADDLELRDDVDDLSYCGPVLHAASADGEDPGEALDAMVLDGLVS